MYMSYIFKKKKLSDIEKLIFVSRDSMSGSGKCTYTYARTQLSSCVHTYIAINVGGEIFFSRDCMSELKTCSPATL